MQSAFGLGRALVMVLGALSPWAEASALGAEQERLLESSRSLGRGNAFVASFDSDDATRSNPATLAEAKMTYQLRALELDLLVGENTIDSIQDLGSLNSEANAVSLLETFNKFGKRQYARAQLMLLAQRLGAFELAPFVTSTNFVDMRIPSMPEVEFRSDTLYGINLSFGFNLGKELRFGMNLKPALRLRYAGQVAFSDLLSFVDDSEFALGDLFQKQTGTLVASDLGAIWEPSKALRFGLLIENLGFADVVDAPEHRPPPFAQRVDLGANYRIDLKPWHWDFLFDLQDVVNPHDFHFLRLLHLGTELGRSYVSRDHDVGIMAGLNEGYVTTGAFVDLYLARLNLSYYAVELGEFPGQRRDRRFAMTLQSSASF